MGFESWSRRTSEQSRFQVWPRTGKPNPSAPLLLVPLIFLTHVTHACGRGQREHSGESTQLLNLLGGQQDLEASEYIHELLSPEGRTRYKIHPRKQPSSSRYESTQKHEACQGLTNFSSDPEV